MRVTRRELIASAGAGAALAAVPPAWAGRLLESTPRVGPGEFLDGVASGEPGPSAVTFWSRLESERPRSGAKLVVARDKELRRVVATTVVPTGRGVNGTLKTRVGGLEPSTEYWYGWESGTDSSPVGRTRTAPARGSKDPVRMGFSSCQNYPVGYFNAHSHAAERDFDLYLFLGDYMYETGGTGEGTPYPRADGIDAVDLASYRRKYKLYRSDDGLRELHRMHPAVHVWDDHEVADNYSDGEPAPSPAQRAAGYRVAFEWLPRLVFPRERHRIYKRISYGSTADVFLLDTRGRRSGAGDEPGHILDEAQMSWLIRELKASTARWKIVAQQVVVATINYGPGTNSDAWDGYPEDRARLLGELERAGVDDVVFLTGDVHVFMVNLLASDFAALGDGSSRKPAAVEYVGGSITSPGIPLAEPALQAQCPWNKQYDAVQHGYATLDLDSERLVTDYLTSAFAAPGGPTATFERFTQPAGENQVERERFPASVRRIQRAQRARRTRA